jgi:MFS family permease
VRYVVRHPVLRPVALSTATIRFGQGGGIAVSVVFLVRDIGLSAGVIGLLGTVGLVGAVLSSGIARRLVAWSGQGPALVGGTLLLGLAFLAQAFTTPGWGLVWWVVSGFVASFCIILTNVVSMTVRQVVCPPELLGRVNAVMELIGTAVVPVSGLLGGWLGTYAGTRVTLLVFGAVACLAVGWLLASPLARRTGFVGAPG